MLEEPSIILRLSCLLHEFINIKFLMFYYCLYTCTTIIIINAKYAEPRPILLVLIPSQYTIRQAVLRLGIDKLCQHNFENYRQPGAFWIYEGIIYRQPRRKSSYTHAHNSS